MDEEQAILERLNWLLHEAQDMDTELDGLFDMGLEADVANNALAAQGHAKLLTASICDAINHEEKRIKEISNE